MLIGQEFSKILKSQRFFDSGVRGLVVSASNEPRSARRVEAVEIEARIIAHTGATGPVIGTNKVPVRSWSYTCQPPDVNPERSLPLGHLKWGANHKNDEAAVIRSDGNH